MSLILEALRKSEAQRRSGQAPALEHELPPMHAANARRPAPLWLWPVAAAVLGGVVLAIVLLRGQSPQSAEVASASPNVFDQPDPATAPAAPLPRMREPEPVSVQPVTPQPSPAAAAPVTAAAPTRAAAAPLPPAPAPAPSVVVEPPAPPSSAAPAPNTSVLAIAEVDASTRRSLPPLHVSMHMYNDDPASRFAIIDGQRMTEGSRSGALVVRRIERDAVVLDHNGQLIRLPIR